MAKNYEHLVKTQVKMAGFPYGLRQESIHKILDALWNLRVIQKTQPFLYCPKNRLRLGPRPPRKHAGRPPLDHETTYLLSTLNSVWMQAFKRPPTANRRGERDSPFVRFAEPILESVGIHNILDNITKYRRHRSDVWQRTLDEAKRQTDKINP